MANDTTTPKVDTFARGASTLLLQAVLLIVALLVTYWVSLQPFTGEEGPPSILRCLLYIGGIYALTGAVVRVLAHKRSDREDYWGKQLGLAGAVVALIGATAVVPTFLFVAATSAFVLGGLVVPLLILAARWLRHRPEDCSDVTAW